MFILPPGFIFNREGKASSSTSTPWYLLCYQLFFKPKIPFKKSVDVGSHFRLGTLLSLSCGNGSGNKLTWNGNKPTWVLVFIKSKANSH